MCPIVGMHRIGKYFGKGIRTKKFIVSNHYRQHSEIPVTATRRGDSYRV